MKNLAGTGIKATITFFSGRKFTGFIEDTDVLYNTKPGREVVLFLKGRKPAPRGRFVSITNDVIEIETELTKEKLVIDMSEVDYCLIKKRKPTDD